VLALPPEQGVPVLDMRDELTVFQGLDNPNRWQGPFRGSPVRWKTPDGDAVVRALREAEANPVVVDVCRYISFEGLREALSTTQNCISFLKPTWLQTISESCALEDL
jgi:hypothetical protein